MWNKIYIGAHLHSRIIVFLLMRYINLRLLTYSALNYHDETYFKPLGYLYEVVRTNFSVVFWSFHNFYSNFAKIVAPSSDENENYVVHLKDQSIVRKKR